MDAKLSIGLPVYNEINYIEETLDSILAQSFVFYELVIVDNCSDDGTYEVLKKYSTKDSRIKIIKNEKNLGMISNYNKAFQSCSGDYFSWVGAHDIYDKNYFKVLMNEHKKNKNSSLVFSNINKIDKENYLYASNKKIGFELRSKFKLFRKLMMPFIIQGSGDMVYGIFKSSELKETAIFSEKVLNPDYLLITQICNYGSINRVDDPLRNRRYFRKDETKFNKWSDKYIHFKKRYVKNNGNVSFLLKNFPTFFMFINIIKVLSLRSSWFFLFNILYSFYASIFFLFRHRSSFIVDLMQFLKLMK